MSCGKGVVFLDFLNEFGFVGNLNGKILNDNFCFRFECERLSFVFDLKRFDGRNFGILIDNDVGGQKAMNLVDWIFFNDGLNESDFLSLFTQNRKF